MNEFAKMITEGTKQLVEASGKKYEAVEFDELSTPTDTEKEQFSKNIVEKVESGTGDVLKRQEEYRKTYGHDPRGNAPMSWSVSQ